WRNLLSQDAEVSHFRLNQNYTAFLDRVLRSDFELPYDSAIASTITIWRRDWPSGGNVFRVAESHEYDPRIDRAGGSGHSAFPAWKWGSPRNPFSVPTPDDPWRMVSQVLDYNGSSQPLFEAAPDGVYSSVLYGHGGKLPRAIIANATSSEAYYFDFEDLDLYSAAQRPRIFAVGGKTGQNLAVVRTADTAHQYVLSLRATPYRVSYYIKRGTAPADRPVRLIFTWTLATSPTITRTRELRHVPASTTWEQINDRIVPETAGGVALTIVVGDESTAASSAYHLLDDLRIVPEDSAMRTFAYDLLSEKVTAMTEEGGTSKSFEYDALGRLVAVRNDAGEVIDAYVYHYRRSQ
ncbi:MAG TPA: RHS repeat domain-containing protein, partial [Steroidobacteraceae bacterium]|nr:RHS repeat domain-containing protein [Steroidobacteraceae bacterium]